MQSLTDLMPWVSSSYPSRHMHTLSLHPLVSLHLVPRILEHGAMVLQETLRFSVHIHCLKWLCAVYRHALPWGKNVTTPLLQCTNSSAAARQYKLIHSMLQDLYPAWVEQGMDWIALHGQDAVTHNQTPAAQAAPAPQDLMLSPEQLQLVTDYFQKVPQLTHWCMYCFTPQGQVPLLEYIHVLEWEKVMTSNISVDAYQPCCNNIAA